MVRLFDITIAICLSDEKQIDIVQTVDGSVVRYYNSHLPFGRKTDRYSSDGGRFGCLILQRPLDRQIDKYRDKAKAGEGVDADKTWHVWPSS